MGWQTAPQTPVGAMGGQARFPGSSTASDQANHARHDFWRLFTSGFWTLTVVAAAQDTGIA